MAADLFCPPWPVEKCQLGIVGVGPGGTKYTRGNRRPFLASRFRFFLFVRAFSHAVDWAGRRKISPRPQLEAKKQHDNEGL